MKTGLVVLQGRLLALLIKYMTGLVLWCFSCWDVMYLLVSDISEVLVALD